MVACKEDDKTMEVVEIKDIQVILFLGCAFLLFIERPIIDDYISYAFKPWEEKIIRKHMNWKEWLLYSRFRSVIPKTLLYPYYFFLLLWILGALACLRFFLFVGDYSPERVDEIVGTLGILCIIHGIYLAAIEFPLRRTTRGPLAYERWYKRPRDEVRRKIRLKYMEKREDLLEENQEQVQQKGRKKTTGNRRKTGTRRKGKREGNKKKK